MTSIHSELKKAVLSAEYAYLLKEPDLLIQSFQKIFEIYCNILFTIYCPINVTGRENIPHSSPFVFCSNHSSHMDTGVLMTASGLPFNKFAMVAAKDYFFNGSRNFLNLLMNLIPVERSAGKRSMIDYLTVCREYTKIRRGNLIVYPEGTRSVTGRIQPFKKGPAMIAAELNLPIVPAFINGTYNALPKGRIFMKSAEITIFIGKPILPGEYICNSDPECNNFKAYKRITEELEKRIRELSEMVV